MYEMYDSVFLKTSNQVGQKDWKIIEVRREDPINFMWK